MELETYTPDNLIAGDFPTVGSEGTLLAGQVYPKGSVLAVDSGNGNKLVLVDSASGTPSIQDPESILAEEVDATGGDVVAPVYISGEFNENALTFGGADDADTHRDALRAKSIFVKKSVPA